MTSTSPDDPKTWGSPHQTDLTAIRTSPLASEWWLGTPTQRGSRRPSPPDHQYVRIEPVQPRDRVLEMQVGRVAGARHAALGGGARHAGREREAASGNAARTPAPACQTAGCTAGRAVQQGFLMLNCGLAWGVNRVRSSVSRNVRASASSGRGSSAPPTAAAV
jgi:hypothetical protein